MTDREPRWPALTAPERAVGLVALTGFAIALSALAAIAVAGAAPALLVVFWCGFCVLVGATLAGLFVNRAIAVLRAPLRCVGAGFLLLLCGFLVEGGAADGSLRMAGHAVLAVGIGWGLWALGGLRR